MTGGSIIGFTAGSILERLLWRPILEDQKAIELETKGSERRYYQKRLTVKQVILWEKGVPGAISSYKRDCKDGLPKFGLVVRFHGRPRPHEVGDKWVKENWI